MLFVQYAYKLPSTKRALEKNSFIPRQQEQAPVPARGTASNLPDPRWFSFLSLGGGDLRHFQMISAPTELLL
eukprot:1158083-Pelagomonas_calceolata.AAC.3